MRYFILQPVDLARNHPYPKRQPQIKARQPTSSANRPSPRIPITKPTSDPYSTTQTSTNSTQNQNPIKPIPKYQNRAFSVEETPQRFSEIQTLNTQRKSSSITIDQRPKSIRDRHPDHQTQPPPESTRDRLETREDQREKYQRENHGKTRWSEKCAARNSQPRKTTESIGTLPGVENPHANPYQPCDNEFVTASRPGRR